MKTSKIRTETDLISRLGCMRRNTVVENAQWGTIEHVVLWMPETPKPAAKQHPATPRPMPAS